MSINNAEKGPGPLSAHARDAEKANDPSQHGHDARDSEATDNTFVAPDTENGTHKPQHPPTESAAMPREPTPVAS